MNPDRLRQNFARQTMMQTLGASLTSLGDGTATIEAPILPGARQQQGFGHAGLTFSLGDSAAGYAALSLMDNAQDVLTVEMKINLLAPARGTRLIAVGTVIKSGRRLTIVRASVWADSEHGRDEIAILQGTMMPVTAKT